MLRARIHGPTLEVKIAFRRTANACQRAPASRDGTRSVAVVRAATSARRRLIAIVRADTDA
jgi:hypothetical protein